ncbi:hypothetical protein LTR37_016017 [Vermiconidia calcicola]|uniref:Uncharacterized protein n=1 Tax=Vermiconidia calcicola TaxID=1690605 RepID=A0ACC3MP52_9PEZI|nr:hypothetical protein LTR37_016017 [Vermiconidia calcicola]
MANVLAPVVHVAISLTSSTFRFSDEESTKPSIIVRSTLITPAIITVDARGERDAGTILGTSADLDFRVENFAFHDVSTSEPVIYDLFLGTCEPDREEFVELHASKPCVTKTLLDGIDPWTDPIKILKPGHTYRVTLKPQTIKCWEGGIDELLARREIVHVLPPDDEDGEEMEGVDMYKYPDSSELTLACDDELILKVEE